MLNKDILHDIMLTGKKQLHLLGLSQLLQTLCLTAGAYVTALLGDRMLFSGLDLPTAAPFLALLLFFCIFRTLLGYWDSLTAAKLSLELQSRLRSSLLHRLAYSSHDRLAAKSEGEWLTLITEGVDKLDTYVTGFLPQFLQLAILPTVLLIFAFINDWISGLIFLFTAPLIPLFMVLIGKLTDNENKKQWQLFQQLGNYLSDLLPGLLLIKAYGQVDRQIKAARSKGQQFSDSTLKVLRLAFLSAFMLEFIATLSIAVIAVNIGLRLLYGQALFLPAFFILLIAPIYYRPFRQFGAAFHQAMNGITAAGEIYGLLREDSSLEDRYEEKIPASGKLPSSTSESSCSATTITLQQPPQIRFQSVSFSYHHDHTDMPTPLLDGLSFTIPAGKETALIGQNGVGKTTVMKLLLQLLEPSSGQILIDGQKLADYEPALWRQHIGCVLQEPYIFTGSIRENICLGRDCSEAELTDAIQAANLDEYISCLPQGYDTILGTEHKPSAGQKRRLGIARAILKKPKLLLLDEPMENLDAANEQLIQELLDRLKGHTTILIIAHRRHTIAKADHIVLLERGKAYEFDDATALM